MLAYVTTENLQQKTRTWLEKVAPFNTHDLQLNTERSALLVVDMQRFFLDPDSPTYTSGGPAVLPL